MFKDTAEEFIYFLELRTSKDGGVIMRYLYWFYTEWCKENARDAINRFLFYRTIKELYEIRIIKGETVAMVDPSHFPKITEEMMDNIDRAYNRERFGRKISKCLKRKYRQDRKLKTSD